MCLCVVCLCAFCVVEACLCRVFERCCVIWCVPPFYFWGGKFVCGLSDEFVWFDGDSLCEVAWVAWFVLCVRVLSMCLDAVFVKYCVTLCVVCVCLFVFVFFLSHVFVWFVCNALCDAVWSVFFVLLLFCVFVCCCSF